MVSVDVGDEERVEGYVEGADARRPSGSERRLRLLAFERREVGSDADLEGFVELESDERVAAGRNLLCSSPASRPLPTRMTFSHECPTIRTTTSEPSKKLFGDVVPVFSLKLLPSSDSSGLS